MSDEEWDIIERVLDDLILMAAGGFVFYWLLSIFTEFLNKGVA